MDVYDLVNSPENDAPSSPEFHGFSQEDIDKLPPIDDIPSDDASSVSSAPSDDDDEDDADLDILEPENIDVNWTSSQFQAVDTHVFNSQTGPVLPPYFDTNSPPLEYFRLFFGEDIIKDIVKHTNNYATWKIKTRRLHQPRYFDKEWREDGSNNATLEEMNAYFGLLILFGINPCPEYKNYWSTNPFIGNHGVRKTMSLRRYEKVSVKM
jgi:hypothetical protein